MSDAAAPRRRFTLFDAGVLVAACAVGLALDRFIIQDFGPPEVLVARWMSGVISWVVLPLYGLALATPLLQAGTLALIPLGLRGRGGRRRRVLLRPGLMACGAATLAVAVELVGWGILGLLSLAGVPLSMQWTTGPRFANVFFGGFPPLGEATAAAWALLALSGRWRAERSWTDRAGRALGAYWIAAIPFYLWISHVR